jgi:hypothetical protein
MKPKNNKDRWNPFSPRLEHELHLERLSREWKEAQETFAFLDAAKVRALAVARQFIRSTVGVMRAIPLPVCRKRSAGWKSK